MFCCLGPTNIWLWLWLQSYTMSLPRWTYKKRTSFLKSTVKKYPPLYIFQKREREKGSVLLYMNFNIYISFLKITTTDQCNNNSIIVTVGFENYISLQKIKNPFVDDHTICITTLKRNWYNAIEKKKKTITKL